MHCFENTLLRKCTFANLHYCENTLLRKHCIAKIHLCENALLRKYISAKVHFAKIHVCESSSDIRLYSLRTRSSLLSFDIGKPSFKVSEPIWGSAVLLKYSAPLLYSWKTPFFLLIFDPYYIPGPASVGIFHFRPVRKRRSQQPVQETRVSQILAKQGKDSALAHAKLTLSCTSFGKAR